MKKQLTRRTFLGASAAAMGLGLAACGKKEDKPAAGESKGTVGGGTITAGSAYKTSNYDPSTTSSALALGVNWHVVEGLYGLDMHDYSVHNELATADPKQVDATTFEVSLRKDAKFSDGTAVTPEDVIESFARATAKGSIYISMLAPITSIEKKDDTTVTIKTSVENFSLLRERLSIVRVVPKASKQEDMKAKPVGSGPWMFENISDTALDLVPNPNYNGEYAPKDKKLHYDVLVDPTARVTAQNEGSTLVMEMVTADAVDQLKASGCQIDTVQGFGTRFMMFNVKKAPWDNVKVRQAVMYALDTEKMITNTLGGMATAASCYLPETFANYHKASTVYTKDVDKAKALLKEAGITPGDITIRTTDNEQVKGMATQAKEDLDALGFNVTINTNTSAKTYEDIDGGDAYDMLLAPGDPSCFGADPDLLLNWWYGNNVWMQKRCPWSDSAEWKKLTDLMAKALTQTGDEQQSTWNECFDLIAENVVLYPILHVKTSTASWAAGTPNKDGVAIENFKGIGTTGMSFLGTNTVTK